MITKTDFQRTGAGALVEYIKRDKQGSVPVKDSLGKELSAERLEEFIEHSRDYGAERHLIIAPDPTAAYSAAEVDRYTQKTMSQWRAQRSSLRYVYAVHQPEDKTHAHVAATGRMPDLRMDKQDLQQFRELSCETFREQERIAQRQRIAVAEKKRKQARLERELEAEAEEAMAEQEEAALAESAGETDADAEQEADSEEAPEQEQEQAPEQEPAPEQEMEAEATYDYW